MIFFGQFLVHFVIRNLCVDIGEGFFQKLGKVSVFIGHNGIFLAESARHGFPFAQYHFRVVYKVGVHLHTIFVDVQVYPLRLKVNEPIPFLQDQNIRNNLRSGISLKGVVGQADCTEQVGSLCDILPHGRIFLIHCAFARDERYHAARSDLV